MSPGRGLLQALAAWLLLGALASAWPPARAAWLGAGALLLAATLAAAWTLRGAPPVTLRRSVAASLPLAEWSEVRLRLDDARPEGSAETALELELFDCPPESAELHGLPARVTVPAGGRAELSYGLRPRRRGDQAFAGLELRRRSFGDLLRRRDRLPLPASVRVLPNFRPVLSQDLAGLEDRLAALGLHLQRQRGEGLEFQELREYRPGDPLRLIDWKATARRGELIARQHEAERDQQVLLLLDCGRRMHARDGELSHFDHVLNAALVLGWTALRQGDAVGLLTFSGRERWLAPGKGPGAMSRLLHQLHDLDPSLEAPDYEAGALAVLQRQRRRALVVVLTNLRDEESEELVPALRRLAGRHLVLLASTREAVLRELTEQEPAGFEAALEIAAAHSFLDARRAAHGRLAGTGILTVDEEPERLPAALVARYLDVKRAGRL